MFSKGKSGAKLLENNAILHHFHVGRLFATGGPEGVWKIYEGYYKTDGKEVSIFVFDKKSVDKLHKPKRKEAMTELLKLGLGHLQCYRHPKLLNIIHSPEESPEALAFASEPLIGSLANILNTHCLSAAANSSHETSATVPALDRTASSASLTTTSMTSLSTPNSLTSSSLPTSSNLNVDYNFIDVEYRYGFSQLTDALTFLHVSCRYVHRNVCPNSVYVTKSGSWKLGSLEFMEKLGDVENSEIPCQAWTNRMPKYAQPDLNFIAPEIQHKSECGIASDMFSLGMVMIAAFNGGQSVIQANHSTNLYFKQAGVITDQVKNVLHRIPVGLQEAVSRLVNPDTRQRPSTQLLSLIQYFSDPAVQALQFLDVIGMKDPSQKAQFFRTTLTEVFPFIPRVNLFWIMRPTTTCWKLWFQHMWPLLQQEIRSQEVLAAVLEPVLFLIMECSPEEYATMILPSLRPVFSNPKSIQASVTLLERLAIILDKSTEADMRNLVLPLLFNSLESKMSQIQMAAVSVIPSILDFFNDDIVRQEILPKTRKVYEQNGGDVKIVLAVLACVSKILDKLDKSAIIDEVLPLLLEVKLQDVNVLVRVLEIFRKMVSDKRYGLSVNLLATKVLPLLIPQLVNPQLQYEHFIVVHEVLQEMFDVIDRHQRNKLKLDDVPKLPEWQRLRYQHTSSNDMSVPNLVIRRASVVQGPMGLHNLISEKNFSSSIQSSSGGSSPENNNYLRVSAAFGQRRLSDNVLTTPGHRKLSGMIGSTVSSPGSAPGTPLGVGFPIRRHSSAAFAANRRYSSNALLSPSTTIQLNQHLGGSMPNCAAENSGYGMSSRRSSRGSTSGLTHSGMYSAFGGYGGSAGNSRRSSAGTGSCRRESGGLLFLNPQDSLDSNPPGFINASSLAASAAIPPGSSGNNGGTGSQSLFSSIGTGVVGAASLFVSDNSSRYRKTFLRHHH